MVSARRGASAKGMSFALAVGVVACPLLRAPEDMFPLVDKKLNMRSAQSCRWVSHKQKAVSISRGAGRPHVEAVYVVVVHCCCCGLLTAHEMRGAKAGRWGWPGCGLFAAVHPHDEKKYAVEVPLVRFFRRGKISRFLNFYV